MERDNFAEQIEGPSFLKVWPDRRLSVLYTRPLGRLSASWAASCALRLSTSLRVPATLVCSCVCRSCSFESGLLQASSRSSGYNTGRVQRGSACFFLLSKGILNSKILSMVEISYPLHISTRFALCDQLADICSCSMTKLIEFKRSLEEKSGG